MIICLTDNFEPDFLDKCEWVGAKDGLTCYPWDVTPREYLEFASADLTGGDQRSMINAVGNAKRAIHSHVDFLLHNCGRCLRDSGFPLKIEMLQRLGIIAPALLVKYNRLRNVMEHDYVSPTAEQAKDVCEVAQLFIEATRMYTRPLPDSMLFRTRDGKQVCNIDCKWDERVLVVQADPVPPGSYTACVVVADKEMSLWTSWVGKILRVLEDASDPYVRCSE